MVVEYGLDPESGCFIRLDTLTFIIAVPADLAADDDVREEYLEWAVMRAGGEGRRLARPALR